MEYLKNLFFLLGGEQRKLPFMIFMFLCLSTLDLAGLSLIGPYVTIIVDPQSLEGSLGTIVNYLGLSKEREDLLVTLGLILVGIFLVKAIAAILINLSIVRFGGRLQVTLRSSLMTAYQSMPYTHYLSKNSSEFIYHLQVLVERAYTVVVLALKLLSDLLVIFAVVILLAFQNVLALMLLLSLVVTLVFIYDLMFRSGVIKYSELNNIAGTKLTKGLNQGMEGFKEIRILGGEQSFHQIVLDAAKKLAFYQRRVALIQTSPRFLLEFVMVIFIVALVIGTILLEQKVELLVATLAMFAVAAIRLLPIASSISSSITTFRFSRDAIFRLYNDFKLLDTFKTEEFVKSDKEAISFQQIALSNVTYSYPNSPDEVLKEISLQIKLGDCIGIVGPSGSGKTTLVDLLLGLLEFQKGEIKYNGKFLDFALHEWQSNVAYLPQEVFLMDETLRVNVALGVEENEIDNSKVIESLKKARLKEFVDQLPLGIETVLGERGMRISGGQRQRVALARAFYHEREVLVLDEATSALDTNTEKEIVKEIRLLKGQKTMIIVAHRLTTLQYCDRIYELQDGRIIKSGSPEEILNLAKI